MTPVAVLIGPPAAGKTRLGKRVARILDVSFVDTDSLIAREHGSIPEIFRSRGEGQFRAWERVAVKAALATTGIVALGGGAVLDSDTQRELENQRVVLVTASAESVEQRLDANSRPLLARGIDDWVKLVASRQPIYDRLATITVDTSRGSMDEHASRLAEVLRSNR